MSVYKNSHKAAIQSKWWKYAAWTTPFSALALIAFAHFLGFEGWYSQVIVLTTTFFFTASVLWWWWALHKLVDIMKGLEAASNGLQSIRESIHEFKEYLKDSNDSNRKR